MSLASRGTFMLEGRQRLAGKITQFNVVISRLLEEPATGSQTRANVSMSRYRGQGEGKRSQQE